LQHRQLCDVSWDVVPENEIVYELDKKTVESKLGYVKEIAWGCFRISLSGNNTDIREPDT
jgi:hypothetical protein